MQMNEIADLKRRVEQLELVVRALKFDTPIGVDERGRLIAMQRVDPSVPGPQKPLRHDSK